MSLGARAPLGLFGERDSRPPLADPVAEVAILTGKRAAIPVRLKWFSSDRYQPAAPLT